MSTAHKPVMRRCVSCMHLKDRTRMLRLVRLADGRIGLGEGFGRSAYVCCSPGCLQDARRRKRVQRSLRIPNHPTIDAALAVMLAAELDNAKPDHQGLSQDSPVS